ncbi:MAG: cyclic nucleotide-binding domain-containing protein [Candidatus Riflebacteria bacterium]|nr:cyclic nucleotide-binding domain-containing protein [Candidatus Riflebacteria bacterium]
MTAPSGPTFKDRLVNLLSDVSHGESDERQPGRLTRIAPTAEFAPRPVEGIHAVALPSPEGALLEGPTGGSCRVTPEELAVFEAMNGERTVVELLYRDMAATKVMTLQRVGGLISRLRRAGLLAGTYAVSQRLAEVLEQRSLAGRLRALAGRLLFFPLIRDAFGFALAALAPIVAVLGSGPGCFALAALAASGIWAMRTLLWRGGIDPLGPDPLWGAVALAVMAWALFVARHLAVATSLAAQGVDQPAVDLGLALGLPTARATDRTVRRAGRSRVARSLLFALCLEAAVGGAAAWGAALLPGNAVRSGPADQLLFQLACVAFLGTFLDLCPLLDLLGHGWARARSGFDDLRARSFSFVSRRLPARLLGGRAEGPASRDDEEPPSSETDWYAGMAVATALWVGVLAWGGRALVGALLPLFNQTLAQAAPGTRSIVLAVGAIVALPAALAAFSLVLWVAFRTVRFAAAASPRVDMSLYVPICLIIAVGVPLAALAAERETLRLASVLVISFATIANPLLALTAARYHRGSRLSLAFRWLAVHGAVGLLWLPLAFKRCGIVEQLGAVEPFLFAITSLGFLLLLPFALFTYLHPIGKWLAAVAAAVPFVAMVAYFGLKPAVLMSREGIAFLGTIGPASFALLAFLTVFAFIETPLITFWTLLAGSLGLSAVCKGPELASILDGSGLENVAFTIGVKGISALLLTAALSAHVLAFRRPRLDTPEGPPVRTSRETVVLASGFVRLANEVVELVALYLGRGRSLVILESLRARVAQLTLPIGATERGLSLDTEAALPEMMELASRLRKLTGDLFRGVTYLAGEEFLKTALILARDRLYWMEREMVSYYLFKGVDLGDATLATNYGLNEGARVAILRRIPLLASLEPALLVDLSARLRRLDVPEGELVIQQGDDGEEFFIILTGQLEVIMDDRAGLSRHLATLGPLDCFGEVALIDGVPRTASVRARTPAVLLSLSEPDFRRLIMGAPDAADRVVPLIRYGTFLSRIPLFGDLSPTQVLALARRLREEHLEQGKAIVTEGEEGDRFYLVREGLLEVTQAGRPLGRLGPGEYFGEIALLTRQPRVATVTALTPVVLLSLGQEDFYAVLSSLLSAFRSIEQFAHRRLYMLKGVSP